MADKWDIEIGQPIASNETEKCETQRQWSELPSLPLEKIYSFLRRPDQFNMALVCHKWSKEFGSPSLWKTFRFALSESQLSMETCAVMQSVRKYASMVRHVEIEYNVSIYNRQLIYKWCSYFLEFLQILKSNSQLISVEFRDFFPCLGVLNPPKCNDMCTAIAEFLGSQCHLKRAEFHNCSFELNEGVQLLRKLTEHSRESLTHLVLRGFVLQEPLDWELDANIFQHLPKLADFPSLTTFETDYSVIFESFILNQSNGIQVVKSCQTQVLSKLILYYSNRYTEEIENFEGLTSIDWWLMKKNYPDLQVELNITTYARLRELRYYIVPNMPISSLIYKNWEIEIAVLFDHLLECNTNDHLVTLHLQWGEPIENLSSTFIPFIQACEKLKCLELFTVPPTKGIDLLLESWLENPHESLEKVIIHVCDIDDEDDYPSMWNLTKAYRSLKSTGLNIMVDLHT